MKKKIIYGVIVLVVAAVGIFSLNAAVNKVSIVSRNNKINHFGAEKNSAYLTNVINEQKSDLNKGKVVLDITIHNSLETEVFYVIDNGKSISDAKVDLINQIKTIATDLEGIGNIKQGISVTTDGVNTLIPLDDKNIADQLESIKNIPSSTTKDGEIIDAITKASNAYSSDAKNKILIVFTYSGYPTTEEEAAELKSLMDNITSVGETSAVVYGISVGSIEHYQEPDYFNEVYGGANKQASNYEEVTGAEYKYSFYDIDFTDNVLVTLPTKKENVATKISFDNVLLENFDVVDVTVSKSVTHEYNANDGIINVGAVTINPNEDLVISYTLQVKSTVDPSVVDITELRTSRQVLLTGGIQAYLPEFSKVEDEVCSPTIKILSETSENPYTGTYDYIIFGSCLMAVALITLVVMNARKSFTRL